MNFDKYKKFNRTINLYVSVYETFLSNTLIIEKNILYIVSQSANDFYCIVKVIKNLDRLSFVLETKNSHVRIDGNAYR